MSRLDGFIRRLEAQRDCLEVAATLIRDVEGAVFELGLGGGRTLDHLRRLCGSRPIFVFDRDPSLIAKWKSDSSVLIPGDIRETLRDPRFFEAAALIHSDLGDVDPALDRHLMDAIVPLATCVLTRNGIWVSSLPVEDSAFVPYPLPLGVRNGKYHIYRCRENKSVASP